MTMKHSPEAWFAEGCKVLDENRLTVAHCTNPADASLIAAAPEILAIVEAFGRHTANPAALFPGMARRIHAVLDSLT